MFNDKLYDVFMKFSLVCGKFWFIWVWLWFDIFKIEGDENVLIRFYFDMFCEKY